MGKLIKNHLARLLTLTAAFYHLLSSILSFFWPKLLFDFLTTTLNPLVKPIPYLQIINTVVALSIICFEYPVPIILDIPTLKTWHARIETRLVVTLPLAMWTSVLGYQTYGAAVGYFCAWGVWWIGFVEGEVVPKKPWDVKKKAAPGQGVDGEERAHIA